jgi:hypothetical protein
MGEGKMNSSVKKQLKFYFDYWKWPIVIIIIVWGLEIIFKQKFGIFITCCCSLGMMINILLINQLKLFPYIIKLGCSRKDYFKSSNLFNFILSVAFCIIISIATFFNGVENGGINFFSELKMFLLTFTLVLLLNFLPILLFNIGNVYWIAIILVILSITITFRYKIYNYINWTRHDTRQGSLEILVCLVLGILSKRKVIEAP